MRRALLLALLAVPAWGQNVLVNPGFEDGLAGWTADVARAGSVTLDGHAHSGDASALVLAPTQMPSAAAIWQEVRVSKGSRYCVSAWLQPWTDGAGFGVVVQAREDRLVELLSHGAPGAWGWQRACFVAPRWRVRVTITASKGVLVGGGYVDDVRLEPVAYQGAMDASILAWDGRLETLPSDRFMRWPWPSPAQDDQPAAAAVGSVGRSIDVPTSPAPQEATGRRRRG